MKRFISSSARCALLLTLCSVRAFGQASDTADLEGLLDTSVVKSASKTAEAADVAPAMTIVITADDLRRYGIHSVDEAINFIATGMITEKWFQSSEIGARGVHLTSDFGSHVLLMLDGHVLNEEWGATAYFDRSTAVPFEIIDRIEIVLGPGSVLYGANAMLGIVNIVSKRAKDFAGGHLIVESEVPTSARGAIGVGKEFQLFGLPSELVLELEYYEQKGPTFAFGPQNIGPDFISGEERDFDVDPNDRKYPPGVWGGDGDDAYFTRVPSGYLRFRLGDLEVGLRGAVVNRSYPTNSGNFDDPNSEEFDHWGNLDIKHSTALSAAVRLSTRLYGDIYEYDQLWTSNGAEDCLEGQDDGCLWYLVGQAQWVGFEPQLTLDWFEDGRVTTLLGLDGRYKHVASTVDYYDNVTGVSPVPNEYSHDEKALAAYLQQTFWATQALGFNAGARLDIDDRFGSHVSPRAAAVLLPWTGGSLKAIYSEAFRAPTAFDLYYYDPTTQLPGGSDLNPEQVRSVEGVLGQRFGAQSLQIGVFRSWWEDLLLVQELPQDEVDAALARGELEPGTQYAYQVKNVSKIKSYGFNIGYEGTGVAGRLRYGVGVTEAWARRQEPGGEEDLLPVAPNFFGNARISYHMGGNLPTLALAGRYVPDRPTNGYPDNGFASPLGELRATISGQTPAPGLSFRVSYNWITAKYGAYTVRGDELVPNDQHRATLGLQYDFPL